MNYQPTPEDRFTLSVRAPSRCATTERWRCSRVTRSYWTPIPRQRRRPQAWSRHVSSPCSSLQVMCGCAGRLVVLDDHAYPLCMLSAPRTVAIWVLSRISAADARPRGCWQPLRTRRERTAVRASRTGGCRKRREGWNQGRVAVLADLLAQRPRSGHGRRVAAGPGDRVDPRPAGRGAGRRRGPRGPAGRQRARAARRPSPSPAAGPGHGRRRRPAAPRSPGPRSPVPPRRQR
ncbi:hypothetical protein SALBM311S_02189 [Streptomyces alboniger]